MNKKGGLEPLFEGICAIACAASLVYFVATGQYLYFVTPSMKGFLYFAAGVFFIWGIYGALQKKRSYRSFLKRFYLFVFIAILVFLPYEHMKTSNLTSAEDVAVNSLNGEIEEVLLSEEEVKNREIDVTEDTFAGWVKMLWNDVHAYEDYTITISGRLVKSEDAGEQNQYTLIRLYMSCCAADVLPIGIPCVMSEPVKEYEEAWVELTGVVKCCHKEEGTYPKIYVKQIKKSTEPEVEYIF